MAGSVLLVEDEPAAGMALEVLLRRAGHDVRRVVDAEAALRAVADGVPDLVVLDSSLPGRDGFDLCQTLRLDASLAPARLLLMIARGTWTEIAKGEAAGADAIIAKPFPAADLLARVAALTGTPAARPADTPGGTPADIPAMTPAAPPVGGGAHG